MASLDFASMGNDELKAYIESLNISLSKVGRQLRDQIHVNRVFCGSANVNGAFSGKDEAEWQRLNLQRQQELLSEELQEARICLRNKQMFGK